MNIRALFTSVSLVAALSACAPTETKTSLESPGQGRIRIAGPGDVVIAIRGKRPMPNIVGGADIWGRTVDTGRISVRFIGTQGNRASFERTDVVIDSDATTLSQTPLIIPRRTTTNISGTVGTTYVNGVATSNTLEVIPPRQVHQRITEQAPIRFSMGKGETISIEGRSLTVLSVSANSIKYSVE